MSAEQIEALLAAARDDQQLADRLTAATTAEEAIAIATSAGYDITEADLQAFAGTLRERSTELTELELSAVAGGSYMSPDPVTEETAIACTHCVVGLG